MKLLRSHPHLFLFEHLAQMRTAASAIWQGHSQTLRGRCGDAWDWIIDAVTFHDSGKAGAAFQAYIPDPLRYRGDKKLKSHTPLSTFCVLTHGRRHNWDWPRLVAVASLAAGHHGELKIADDLRDGLANAQFIIEGQLASLDWDALDAAIGLRVARIEHADFLDAASDVDDQIEELFEQLRESPDLLSYRLKCQLAFSVLLEADKAFLAVDAADISRYIDHETIPLPVEAVDVYLGERQSTTVNPLRDQARAALLEDLASPEAGRVRTMTLPTGLGKTLLGATWALALRERSVRDGSTPSKIIIVLPYLSIVDQTDRTYREFLDAHLDKGGLSSYHSLSVREFDSELGEKSQEFFLDTWQSDVIITTFDQLLLAIFSPRAKHQIRFHNLADALIVLDEVQAFPCILWEPMRRALTGLTELGGSRILAMSATQPGFLPEAKETIADPPGFFARMARCRIVLKHQKPAPLSDFIQECRGRLPSWKGRRVLITLNTRKSARRVFDALADKARENGLPVYFITADRTPLDRLDAIDKIREGKPCLVVSTQTVEAGVDIDLDLILRDFGPLDSLIQIAGRCNRNGAKARGVVEVVSLFDDDAQSTKRFAEMIYDPILLQETRGVLEGLESIPEEEVYPLTLQYFERLRGKKNLGEQVADDWINWREIKPIRSLLRGEQTDQVSFIVIDQKPELRGRLDEALAVEDRWERRRAFRRLAPDMAKVTVSVRNPKYSPINPADYAEPFPPGQSSAEAWFWLLNSDHYHRDRGIDIAPDDGEESWGVLI